jgi:hypothetical protein
VRVGIVIFSPLLKFQLDAYYVVPSGRFSENVWRATMPPGYRAATIQVQVHCTRVAEIDSFEIFDSTRTELSLRCLPSQTRCLIIANFLERPAHAGPTPEPTLTNVANQYAPLQCDVLTSVERTFIMRTLVLMLVSNVNHPNGGIGRPASVVHCIHSSDVSSVLAAK